jgi:16S rRNA (guanine527-N7)-methyltransferase
MDLIRRYFPELTNQQLEQFEALYPLYEDWNQKINVISRKDFENLYERHVVHSLGIVKFVQFKPESSILDIGTGGGFPGIPLAIYYPMCRFHLIDSIQKKLTVVQEVAKDISLENCTIKHTRVEDEKGRFDFVVSRAVMPLGDLVRLSRKNCAVEQKNALPNGLICLKGGGLEHEIAPFKKRVSVTNLSEYFSEEFFKTKKVVYLPLL